jgi:preprotein translocase subunit Sec61beta
MKIDPRNILIVGVLVLVILFAISKLMIIFIEAFEL